MRSFTVHLLLMVVLLSTIALTGCGGEDRPTAASEGANPPRTTVLIFQADLQGVDVTPEPVSTEGSGAATAILKEHRLTVHGSFTGLSSPVEPGQHEEPELADAAEKPEPAGIHLHQGGAGEVGPAVFALEARLGEDGRSGAFVGNFELNEQQIGQLTGGQFYLDIHTADHPEGELRGQLERAE